MNILDVVLGFFLVYLIVEIVLFVLFHKKIFECMSEEERQQQLISLMPFVVFIVVVSMGIAYVRNWIGRMVTDGSVR